MAKKSPASATPSVPNLTFRDLVLGADAETIHRALEARLRIDELIVERRTAYERIAALETQIEDVIGEPGVFPFPAPPLPVAGIDPKTDILARPSPGSAAVAGPATSAATKKEAVRPRPEAAATAVREGSDLTNSDRDPDEDGDDLDREDDETAGDIDDDNDHVGDEPAR